MADAWTRRPTFYLPERVSRTEAEGRRAFYAGCLSQRPRVLGVNHSGLGCVRSPPRTFWSERSARSYRGASRASARLFLSVDVRRAGVATAANGDDPVARRTGDCHRFFDLAAFIVGHR